MLRHNHGLMLRMVLARRHHHRLRVVRAWSKVHAWRSGLVDDHFGTVAGIGFVAGDNEESEVKNPKDDNNVSITETFGWGQGNERTSR